MHLFYEKNNCNKPVLLIDQFVVCPFETSRAAIHPEILFCNISVFHLICRKTLFQACNYHGLGFTIIHFIREHPHTAATSAIPHFSNHSVVETKCCPLNQSLHRNSTAWNNLKTWCLITRIGITKNPCTYSQL